MRLCAQNALWSRVFISFLRTDLKTCRQRIKTRGMQQKAALEDKILVESAINFIYWEDQAVKSFLENSLEEILGTRVLCPP